MTVLAEARSAGLAVQADGDRLVVRGPRSAEHLALRVLEHKSQLLPLLRADGDAVAWRADAMRPQVPASGPIPFLVARDVAGQPDCCLSCGDQLPADRTYRCTPCVAAAWRVLNELREGLTGGGTRSATPRREVP